MKKKNNRWKARANACISPTVKKAIYSKALAPGESLDHILQRHFIGGEQ